MPIRRTFVLLVWPNKNLIKRHESLDRCMLVLCTTLAEKCPVGSLDIFLNPLTPSLGELFRGNDWILKTAGDKAVFKERNGEETYIPGWVPRDELFLAYEPLKSGDLVFNCDYSRYEILLADGGSSSRTIYVGVVDEGLQFLTAHI